MRHLGVCADSVLEIGRVSVCVYMEIYCSTSVLDTFCCPIYLLSAHLPVCMPVCVPVILLHVMANVLVGLIEWALSCYICID